MQSFKEQYAIRLPAISPSGLGRRPESDAEIKLLSRDIWTVRHYSSKRNRRAVWKLAGYFRIEFGYDFVQFGHDGDDDDDKYWAFLWKLRDDYAAFGACCFRWREWRDRDPSWALQWIWMHPFARNQGHLSAAWPMFREQFGDFAVERPISRAMAGFIESRAEGS